MDKEKAKWLLASYRPDTTDVEDPVFKEALELVKEDHELGEWLAKECEFNAAFADGLSKVEVDQYLRDKLDRIILGDAPEQDEALAAMDHQIMSGLDAINAPSDLRDRIMISADLAQFKKTFWSWKNLRNGLAIAACLMLGAWLVVSLNSESAQQSESTLAVADVLNAFEAPTEMTLKSANFGEIQGFFKESNGTVPYMLAKGLGKLEIMGCSSVSVQDLETSLICFRVPESGEILHLLVFAKGSLEGELPDMKSPLVAGSNRIASAAWRCPVCDYLLVGAGLTKQRMSSLLG